MSAGITMRYGCNPHQQSARCYAATGSMPLQVLNGGASYINLLDALNAWQLVRELKQALGLPAAASFKHLSPAGAAVAVPLDDNLAKAYFVSGRSLSPLAAAYARARGADRLASFGDFIGLSDQVDVSTAELIKSEMSDGIIAPGYDPEALEILKGKKGGAYRVFQIDPDYEPAELETRQIFGLNLEQQRNDFVPDDSFFANVVSQNNTLSDSARRDLIVATIAVKYTQSNSICLALDGQVIGTGAGQQSRVHCVRLAASKADLWYLRQHPRVLDIKFKKGTKRADRNNAIDLFLQPEATEPELAAWRQNFRNPPERLSQDEKEQWLTGLKEVALSSDAFFPFRDNIDRAAKSGVSYLVQAGGSVQDAQVTAACDEYGMVMVHSGIRLFHH